MHRVEKSPLGETTEDALHQERRRLSVKSRQLQFGHRPVSTELAKEPGLRVLLIWFITAVGADEQQRARTEVAGQEVDDLHTPRIGPVEVFEDHNDRRRLRQRDEAVEQRLEQAGLAHLGCQSRCIRSGTVVQAEPEPSRREDGRGGRRFQLLGQLAQDTNHGTVGKAATFRRRAETADHQRARRERPLAKLLDEASLANPGITADQDRARA